MSRLKVNILKFILLFSGLFALPVLNYAQEKVLVENIRENGSNVIMVKWFIKELYTKDGFFVYRNDSEQSSWQKLNSQPIHLGDYTIPPERYKNDELLEFLIELVINQPQDKIEDMAQFTMVLKAIIDNDFARYLGILFIDNNTEQGKNYKYKITRYDGIHENLVAISDAINSDTATVVLPPEDRTLIPDNKSVYFKWKPESEKYFAVNIYRRDTVGGNFRQINELPVIISEKKDENGNMSYPEFFYADKELENGKSYEYLIKSIDFFGIESSDNQTFTAIPLDPTPPAKPKDVDANFENGNVVVSWKYSNTTKIEGFNIYRGRKSKGEYIKLNNELLPVQTQQYQDISPAPRNYYYYVTSVNKYGIEGESAMAFVEVPDLLPPAKPTGLIVEADTGKFVVHWNANSEADLLGYHIYRKSMAPGNDFFQITQKPVSETRFVDYIPRNVKNQFEYKIVAIDSSYNISEMSDLCTSALPDVTPPEKPFIKAVEIVGKGMRISWEPNVEEDLQGYMVFRTSVDKDSRKPKLLTQESLSGNNNFYIDEFELTEGEYEYTLVAIDNSGNKSQPSERYLFQYLNDEVAEPVELLAISGKYIKKGKKNLLSWKLPADANGFLGTMVYRKTEGDVYKACSGLLTDDSFTDKDIKPETLYQYELRTFTNSGKKWKSDTIQIKTEE